MRLVRLRRPTKTLAQRQQADLQDYARVYEQAYGQPAKVTELIPSMLEAFMASDSNFKKARKALTT